MKKTIFICLSLLTVIMALNFSISNQGDAVRKEASHTVKICFGICPTFPPDTKAHVVDNAGIDYGECKLENGQCCKVYNVPDGVRHIHFTQDGSTFCNTPDFTLSADTTIYIPCTCP